MDLKLLRDCLDLSSGDSDAGRRGKIGRIVMLGGGGDLQVILLVSINDQRVSVRDLSGFYRLIVTHV